jgi:hypothetical protein
MERASFERAIWDEKDFQTMQWHDCKVYAVAFDSEKFELVFDIDFIVEWVTPKDSQSSYEFWVVPATLAFKNVHELTMDVDSVDLIIDTITRGDPSEPKNVNYVNDLEYKWTIETNNGELSFKSVGYEQFARAKPLLSNAQVIEPLRRGEISFGKKMQ